MLEMKRPMDSLCGLEMASRVLIKLYIFFLSGTDSLELMLCLHTILLCLFHVTFCSINVEYSSGCLYQLLYAFIFFLAQNP